MKQRSRNATDSSLPANHTNRASSGLVPDGPDQGGSATFGPTNDPTAGSNDTADDFDLGLTIGTATDVAIETSDLRLVSGDLHAAAERPPALARDAARLSWAFGYNVAGLCFAGPFSNGETRTRTGDTTIFSRAPGALQFRPFCR